MSNFIKLYKKGPGGLEPLAVAGEQLLSNAVDSASEDVGASSLAVKTAYDKGAEGLAQANAANAAAVTAQNTADGKVSKSLADATGVLPVANGGTGTASASGVQRLVGIPGITQRISNLEEQIPQGVYLWTPDADYASPSLTFGPNDSKLYQALLPSGPGVAGVGPKEPGAAGSEAYWKEFPNVADYGDRIPTGFVLPFAANSAPDGYILCNGAAVSRTTYATLFGVIGTLYGAGDGSTTFNIPNLTDRVIQGSGTSGTYRAAGLPNIMGQFTIMDLNSTSIGPDNMLFYKNTGNSHTATAELIQRTHDLGYCIFNAQGYNNIYGASNTVQPPSLTMRYYIKY